MSERTRVYAYVAVVALAVVAVAVSAVLGLRSQRLEPAEQAIQDLLELRSENSTDTAAYARYVESTSVASALAEDSAAREGDASPIPEWEPPRTLKETSSTAEVVVEWRRSEAFADWPETTVFVVARRGERWILVDAEESSAESEEPTATPESSSDEPAESEKP